MYNEPEISKYQSLIQNYYERGNNFSPASLRISLDVNYNLVENLILFEPYHDNPYAISMFRIRGASKSHQNIKKNSKEDIFPLMANVISGLSDYEISLVYLLFGSGYDIDLYVGVKSQESSSREAIEKAKICSQSLKICINAAFPDVIIKDFKTIDDYNSIIKRIKSMKSIVFLIGNPGINDSKSMDESTIDQMIRALAGSNYCYCVEAKSISHNDLDRAFQNVINQIAEVHKEIKWTENKKVMEDVQESHEHIDRFAQHFEEILENSLKKIDAGIRQGMWSSTVTLLSPSNNEIQRCGALLRSVFASSKSLPEPVRCIYCDYPEEIINAVSSFQLPSSTANDIGLSSPDSGSIGTPLCSADLSLLVDLPQKEMPGYRIGIQREFALDKEPIKENKLNLGSILSQKSDTKNQFTINVNDLTRHALIVGTTGSGKTNTAMHILHQVWKLYKIPFLVIEPAKAQYRNLLSKEGLQEDLQIFSPGLTEIPPFRINPFEIPPKIDPQTHISNLYTVFNAAFILYAPMPYVLERSLYEVYEEKGWDFGLGRHRESDKNQKVNTLAYPTLTDLYYKIGEVVKSLGYDKKIEMDVIAGLQARIDSLRIGQKGQTFDCRSSIPFDLLFQRPTILELENIGSDEEKAFFMGLLLMRLYEHLKGKGESKKLVHLTMVEEAHRILTKVQTESSSSEVANMKGKSVESFCNILAEIRAYGEGVIIAEQIPSKLMDDVLKNTNLKIMHTIVAADDRKYMGGAMNIIGRQDLAVTSLKLGEAIVFSTSSFSQDCDLPFLVKVPYVDVIGTASNEDVSFTVTEFYKQYPGILKTMPGCFYCTDVCHYGSIAKRYAFNPDVINTIWNLAVSLLEQYPGDIDIWNLTVNELLKNCRGLALPNDQKKDFAWCLLSNAAGGAFWELRRTTEITLDELEKLNQSFIELFDAIKKKNKNIGGLHDAYRRNILKYLNKSTGDLTGCDSCSMKCFYRPLGRWISGQVKISEEISKTYKREKPAIADCCRKIASDFLFVKSGKSIKGLSYCIFLNWAKLKDLSVIDEDTEHLFE